MLVKKIYIIIVEVTRWKTRLQKRWTALVNEWIWDIPVENARDLRLYWRHFVCSSGLNGDTSFT